MSDSTPPSSSPEAVPPTLDLRSGGWVLLLAVVALLGVVVWLYRAAHISGRGALTLDVDLGTSIVARETLVVATTPDALPPLLASRALAPDAAEHLALPEHARNLLPSDLVVGVALGGEARAYPIRILNWHEVAQDSLGGAPIAVTWSPLSGSARVFDRRVEGETLDLAASGVLLDSSLVLYDRRAPASAGPGPRPSLWSQLQARAIAGPAAGRGARLRPVPAQLVAWQVWLERHPETTVVAPDLSRAQLYGRDPYHSYTGSEELHFLVSPLPPVEGTAPRTYPRKTPVVVVGPPGQRVVYPLPVIAQRTDLARVWTTTQAGVPLTFRYRATPPSVEVELPADAPFEVVHSYWFAWFATHPDDARLVE